MAFGVLEVVVPCPVCGVGLGVNCVFIDEPDGVRLHVTHEDVHAVISIHVLLEHQESS